MNGKDYQRHFDLIVKEFMQSHFIAKEKYPTEEEYDLKMAEITDILLTAMKDFGIKSIILTACIICENENFSEAPAEEIEEFNTLVKAASIYCLLNGFSER